MGLLLGLAGSAASKFKSAFNDREEWVAEARKFDSIFHLTMSHQRMFATDYKHVALQPVLIGLGHCSFST